MSEIFGDNFFKDFNQSAMILFDNGANPQKTDFSTRVKTAKMKKMMNAVVS
jgi:hypothetical protein